MEDQIITGRTAELAKEKGFNIKTDKNYSKIWDGIKENLK